MITLKQIAGIVGVSQATVSRVLNFDATLQVLPQTRQAIIETAEALNYATPRARQGKAPQWGRAVAGKSRKIAMMHYLRPEQELADPYYVGLRLGIESRSATLGLDLSKVYHGDDPSEARLAPGLAGVIAIGYHDDTRTAWLKDHVPNLVFADHRPYDDQIDSVAADLGLAMRRLMVGLTGSGYRRLGFVGWANRDATGRITSREPRCVAYMDWMQAAGQFDPDICQIDFNTEDSGYRLTQSVLSRPNRPDCLICGNDNMAVGAYRAIAEMGLKLPEDIAIASFNDISVAQMLNPPLSTVHLPAEETGETAVDLLMERINGRRVAKGVTLATRMIWRGSTRAPATA